MTQRVCILILSEEPWEIKRKCKKSHMFSLARSVNVPVSFQTQLRKGAAHVRTVCVVNMFDKHFEIIESLYPSIFIPVLV